MGAAARTLPARMSGDNREELGRPQVKLRQFEQKKDRSQANAHV